MHSITGRVSLWRVPERVGIAAIVFLAAALLLGGPDELAAADPRRFPDTRCPWHVPKLYYTAWARSEMLRVFKLMHYLGRKTPLRDPHFDPTTLGCPDALITTRVDVRPVMRAKWRALFAHRSQMGWHNFFWWFLRLSGRWLYPYESFRCVRSPVPLRAREDNIFAGL